MKTTSEMKISTGIRILQIIVGVIAIALFIAVIVNPGFGIEFLDFNYIIHSRDRKNIYWFLAKYDKII